MKVFLKVTDCESKNVVVSVFAKGGQGMISESKSSSCPLAVIHMMESGVANLNGIQLGGLLNKYNAEVSVNVLPNFRNILIDANSEHLDFLLKLVRAIFLHKRFDKETWSNFMEKMNVVEKFRRETPEIYFADHISSFCTKHNPLYNHPTVDSFSEDDAIHCMTNLFSDLGEFTLVVAGDINVNVAEAMVRNSLNVVSNDENRVQCVNEIPDDIFPSVGIDDTISLGTDTNTQLVFCCGSESDEYNNPGSLAVTEATLEILQKRLLRKIRCEYGETYFVNVSNQYS